MRLSYLILGLAALVAVLAMFMGTSPEHAEQLQQMHRDAAFSGQTRDMVLLLLAIGVGGFIAYLTITRR